MLDLCRCDLLAQGGADSPQLVSQRLTIPRSGMHFRSITLTPPRWTTKPPQTLRDPGAVKPDTCPCICTHTYATMSMVLTGGAEGPTQSSQWSRGVCVCAIFSGFFWRLMHGTHRPICAPCVPQGVASCITCGERSPSQMAQTSRDGRVGSALPHCRTAVPSAWATHTPTDQEIGTSTPPSESLMQSVPREQSDTMNLETKLAPTPPPPDQSMSALVIA